MARKKVLTIGAAALVACAVVAVLRIASAQSVQPAHVPPAAPPAPPAPPADEPPLPVGQQGEWRLVFSDEFEGSSLDLSKWTDTSSAEADHGHGNKDNDQLEWNHAANCAVAGGELAMTARREAFIAPSGTTYAWTSCLLSTAPSYAFRYGFIEERAVLPAQKGFWPAFWTWQASGVETHIETHIETDVYEFYSANRRVLHLTQHSGRRGDCRWRSGFDPAAGWHTYGASIEPSGTVWYVDGVEVCRTNATSGGMTNIITNLAVHAAEPPLSGVTTEVKRVDYVRAWQRPYG
jgi:beta-glucanase (GH16 family)